MERLVDPVDDVRLCRNSHALILLFTSHPTEKNIPKPVLDFQEALGRKCYLGHPHLSETQVGDDSPANTGFGMLSNYSLQQYCYLAPGVTNVCIRPFDTIHFN